MRWKKKDKVGRRIVSLEKDEGLGWKKKDEKVGRKRRTGL